MTPTHQPSVTVYFDGASPVVSSEIEMHRRQFGPDAVQCVNVAQCVAPTRALAAALLESAHVRA